MCQQLAQHLWSQPDTISRVEKRLPSITTAPLPTADEIATFTPAARDTLNGGVLDEFGSRLPPQFDAHVDDSMYADVACHLRLTLCSSILALYIILGFPGQIRDCVSWDKFQSKFSHQRKTVGWIIDSRDLTISDVSSSANSCVLRSKQILSPYVIFLSFLGIWVLL